MFAIDLPILYLAIGLLGLILVNILLGSVSAILSGKFDWVKFRKGLIKGVIVTICFMAVYFIGQLVPDIIVMQMNGQEVTLLTAIHIILLSSFLYYCKEVVTKLIKFTGAKFDSELSTTSVPATNTAEMQAASMKTGDRNSGEPPNIVS